ncbi:MAG: DegT/DnrJ/EryC1/StrS aminotransferase family protein [Phycisphaeraceae bacterium]|nr:DegT/DnrJ/EryC1/StrS aminotransferase family protein [Phycisphaeraceae bacterium]
MPVIPLNQPELTKEDLRAVSESLRRGRLVMGPSVLEFERLMAERTRRPYAIAVASGGLAMEIALKALGIGPGDEVLVPAFGHASYAHSVLHCGARPVFVDIEPRSLSMDAARAERACTVRTRAILAGAPFGNPIGLPALVSLCTRLEIPLVENGGEGLGSELGRDCVGRFGRIASFGFFVNRPVTTGEGGMLVTHDDHLAAACRALRNQGRMDRMSFPGQDADLGMILDHRCDGYDARMPELCAALGASQLSRLDETMARRQEIVEEYVARLAGNSDLILPTVPEGAKISWSAFVVRLSDRFSALDRDLIINTLHRHDVGAANYYPCQSLLPHVRSVLGTQQGDFPVAESVAGRTLALPLYDRMTSEDVKTVAQVLEIAIGRLNVTRD